MPDSVMALMQYTRRMPNQLIKVVFVTWPAPYAMRYLWNEWLDSKRHKEQIILIDASSNMNNFLKHFSLPVASKFFFLSRIKHIGRALGAMSLAFFWQSFRDRRKFVVSSPKLNLSDIKDFLESVEYSTFIQRQASLQLMLVPSRSHSKIELEEYLDNLCSIFLSSLTKAILQADEWVFFSGRFPIDGVLRVFARFLGKKTWILEGGALPNSHSVWSDLWNPKEWREKIEIMWQKFPELERREISDAAYKEILDGRASVQTFFAGHQDEDVQHDFDGRQVVTFFASSEFELLPDALFDDDFSYSSQHEAIKWVVGEARKRGFFVIIKEHPWKPSQGFLSDRSELLGDIAPNEDIAFLDLSSRISSRSLIEKSSYCVTFGSSVAIEIVGHARPLLVLGPNVIFSEQRVSFFWNNQHRFFDNPKDFVLDAAEVFPYLFFQRQFGTKNIIKQPLRD